MQRPPEPYEVYLLVEEALKLVIFFFFADDSLLFCHATMDECHNSMSILQLYEQAFGQKLNQEKTSLFLLQILLKTCIEPSVQDFIQPPQDILENILDFLPLLDEVRRKLFLK
jgi:hypothetical protein